MGTGNLKKITKIASNLKEITPALLEVFSGGDVGLISKVISSSSFWMLNEVSRRLEEEGKQVDFSVCGIETPLLLAQKGAGKHEWARTLWMNALKKVLDPDFDHSIRNEDIRLMERLNPIDLVLLFIVGKFRREMNEDLNNSQSKIALERLKSQDPEIEKFLHKGFHLDSLFQYFKLAFNQDLKVPVEEIFYALKALSSKEKSENRVFTGLKYIYEKHFFKGGATIGLSGFYDHNAEKVLSVFLNPQGVRLYRVISDVNDIS
jgi:hypothetical protein